MSLVDDYYKKCATCMNYSLGSDALLTAGVGYRCSKYGKAKSLGDSCGPHLLMAGYTYNKRVTDSDIAKAKKKIDSNNCFITTTVVKILGLNDNNEVLEALRNFRNEEMQPNPKYHFILEHYDRMGPEIAYAMQDDPDKEELAKMLYERCIAPMAGIVTLARHTSVVTGEVRYDEELTDDAINIYVKMTNFLADIYGINNVFYDGFEYANKEDALASGHGRKRTAK